MDNFYIDGAADVSHIARVFQTHLQGVENAKVYSSYGTLSIYCEGGNVPKKVRKKVNAAIAELTSSGWIGGRSGIVIEDRTSLFCAWVLVQLNQTKASGVEALRPGGHSFIIYFGGTSSDQIAINHIEQKRYGGGVMVTGVIDTYAKLLALYAKLTRTAKKTSKS